MLVNKAGAVFSLLCVITVVGCNTTEQRNAPPSGAASTSVASQASQASQQYVASLNREPEANRKEPCEGNCPGQHTGAHFDQRHENCPGTDELGAPAADTVRTGKDPKTGKTMSMVGQPLAAAPVVTVKQLVNSTDEYAGKNVRIEGNVTAMCHHRRAWFTVQDPGDRTGSNVRVTTLPTFLVPPDAIGKQVRVEGTVWITQTSPAFARHLAENHRVGQHPTEDKPVKTITLRARGAEFY